MGHSLRTASIVALTPLELIHFTAEQLERLAEDMPAFHEALEKTAAARFPAVLTRRDASDPEARAVEAQLLGEPRRR